ncbi:MAG: hypothetical protein Q4D93_05185 [Porphyromonas sp.]|nr:hypothetical protein [Porphyromonas sp.]
MSKNKKFWSGFKAVVLVLLVITIVGSVLAFLLLPDVQGQFFGLTSLILAFNLLLIYFFIRINDRRRPTRRDDSSHGEESRFDFRKRDL